MARISIDELKHIAKLAKLEFNEAELTKFAVEFNSILEHISEIAKCDTTEIAFEHNLADYNGDVLMPDVVRQDVLPADILSVSGDRKTNGNYIKTSKIVSKG